MTRRQSPQSTMMFSQHYPRLPWKQQVREPSLHLFLQRRPRMEMKMKCFTQVVRNLAMIMMHFQSQITIHVSHEMDQKHMVNCSPFLLHINFQTLLQLLQGEFIQCSLWPLRLLLVSCLTVISIWVYWLPYIESSTQHLNESATNDKFKTEVIQNLDRLDRKLDAICSILERQAKAAEQQNKLFTQLIPALIQDGQTMGSQKVSLWPEVGGGIVWSLKKFPKIDIAQGLHFMKVIFFNLHCLQLDLSILLNLLLLLHFFVYINF